MSFNEVATQVNTIITENNVIQIIDDIISLAISQEASDIHFEAFIDKMRVRLRLDGVLSTLVEYPKSFIQKVAVRLKVLAELDISEQRLPQDGRITINNQKLGRVDFRINTCPTLFGEKIALRLLQTKCAARKIDALGLSDCQLQILINHIISSQGLILVTGPTGSGKTNTLYAALQYINRDSINISSIEDPVEITMPGINQLNINPKIGLNFVTALRAFMRQDPDVILIGEIRDHETAQIACHAAQTGHLVFASLHTNNADETMSRLSQMGVAEYQIKGAIKLIIAQRLIRKLCPLCKDKITLKTSSLTLEIAKHLQVKTIDCFLPVGCDRCNNGYKGRIGIFEMIECSEKPKQTDKLISQAIMQLCQGNTSVEEIQRILL